MSEKFISDGTLTDAQIISMLLTTITALNISRPEFYHSKMILVPDPRDQSKLLGIHTGPKGTAVLREENWLRYCEAALCPQCLASLRPFSIIHTGIDLRTGMFDPYAFIGLEGGHVDEAAPEDQSQEEEYIEGQDPVSAQEVDPTAEDLQEISKTRTLN